jgi:lipopolysaccharide heptosyltransferase II
MSDTQPAQRWRQARRVLLVRLDGLGDVLMCTPAMAAVRAALPLARLTLLTSPAAAGLAPHLPALDQVIAFEAPWVRGPRDAADPFDAATPATGHAERALLRHLRRERFDAAVIFSTCTQSALPAALLCRLAGIPLRLAYSREPAYGLLSDRLPESDVLGPEMRHEVQRQLDLVASVGFEAGDPHLRFTRLPADDERMRQRLASLGLEAGRAYVLLHPGATAPSRRYPPEAYAAAMAQLRASAPSGVALVVCAGAGESALLAPLQAPQAGWVPLVIAEPLSLGELAALVAGARVLVANNSGPVHLAAALGTPVVDVYALTNPQHTPWRVRSRVLSHEVPCRDCLQSRCPLPRHPCLRGVPPAAVAQAALELLAEVPS